MKISFATKAAVGQAIATVAWAGDEASFPAKKGKVKVAEGGRYWLGMGARKSPAEPRDWQAVGAGIVKAAETYDLADLAVSVSADGADLAQAALGARMAAYRFVKHFTESDAREEKACRLQNLVFLAPEPAGFAKVSALADAADWARDLTNEPANIMTPARFAQEVKSLEQLGVEVSVLDKAALESAGLNLLLAVGAGSANPPALAVAQWRGGPAGEAPFALIGKGLCFDAGGLQVKPDMSMYEMHMDMAGAATVMAAVRALAAAKAPVNVVAVAGLAENMLGASASKPGDIVKSYKGLEVEIKHTDAEGRLVLADVLAYAQERFKPAAMVDAATLTGAICVALGSARAGAFSTSEPLSAALQAAEKATGERVWLMPMDEDYEDGLKSSRADLHNNPPREGSSIAAALFLKKFVDTKTCAWAHLDIAGTAMVKGASTGWGVAFLADLAEHYRNGKG
ncbi:putative cytosol aminopeptidase [Alphaproteobacteria bacterium]|nr:putative cytosol aminopeptidase [Alphaproteobacteria bacterium]